MDLILSRVLNKIVTYAYKLFVQGCFKTLEDRPSQEIWVLLALLVLKLHLFKLLYPT